MSRSFQEISDDLAELVPGIEIGIPLTEGLELILAELRRLKALAGEAK